MPNYLASWQPPKRRDARAAEWTGLENRSRGNSTGGSNPPLSATIQTLSTLPFNDSCHTWYSVGIFTWYKTRHHHLLICPILEDPMWEKFSLFCHKPQPGFQFCDLRILAFTYSSLRNPIFPWLWDHEKYTAVFYLVFFLLQMTVSRPSKVFASSMALWSRSVQTFICLVPVFPCWIKCLPRLLATIWVKEHQTTMRTVYVPAQYTPIPGTLTQPVVAPLPPVRWRTARS